MPVWAQIALVALGVVRELLKYLRERKKCDHKEQIETLSNLKKDIKLATKLDTDLDIKI